MDNSTFEHDSIIYVAIPVDGVASLGGFEAVGSVGSILDDVAMFLSIIIADGERRAAAMGSDAPWSLSDDVTVYDSVTDLAADVEEAADALGGEAVGAIAESDKDDVPRREPHLLWIDTTSGTWGEVEHPNGSLVIVDVNDPALHDADTDAFSLLAFLDGTSDSEIADFGLTYGSIATTG